MNALQLKWHKLFHWEYWPMEAIYLPILPVWLYYAFKAKSLFFFSAANPSIKNGGMAMESKKEIYDIIPGKFIPKTLLIKKEALLSQILEDIIVSKIQFPFIAKPDIGMKALGVDQIHTEEELKEYSKKLHNDFLIQELITYPNELGVFYVRFPGESDGKITGIVQKKFLSVKGNGVNSILDLINRNPRCALQLNSLQRKFGEKLDEILPSGEIFILVPYGSHTRGAEFIDISHKSNDKLNDTLNSICKQIPGFYFGRLDIRYEDFELLCEGKNFSIIEINGAGSEPTHIYDPKHSLFFAWREIIRHWRMLYQISQHNNKEGYLYLSYSDGRAMLKANSKLEAQLRLF